MRAPIAGTVVQKLVLPGQVIQAGATAAFVISDVVDRLGAGARLRARTCASVHVGDTVDVRNASFPTAFHGVVSLHRRHARSRPRGRRPSAS